MAVPGPGRRRVGVLVALAIAAGLLPPTSALGISNGVPDGDGHPNVGLLAVERDGHRYLACSGSYAGAHKNAPVIGVFLTAGHCVNWVPESGISASRLWVTFEPNITVDQETIEVTAASWHQAMAVDFDPAFGHDHSNIKDYGVVLLAGTVPVAPIQLPSAGLLDALAANGGLRPDTVFDNVGYGAIPSFKRGPVFYSAPPGRMFSTSRFQALTPSWLKLLMNSDAGEENGGICFFDSGSPKFLHETNTVVAVASGGDAICRAENYNQRLDVADARAFLGRYLQLP